MTRYIKHKYGLLVASDNIFYLESADGVFRDHYKALVLPFAFECDPDDDLTRFRYVIDTPAQQLIWEQCYQEENWGKYFLNPSMAWWLDENIGPKYDKWDARKINHTNAEPVFFKGRNDAVKFAKFVKAVVGGLSYKNRKD